MQHLKCLEFSYIRHVVISILTLLFLYSLVQNVIKYKEKKTVVAESEKSTSDVVFPSLTMCPRYEYKFPLSTSSATKNMTQDYENILNMLRIRKDIVEISQPLKTGWAKLKDFEHYF